MRLLLIGLIAAGLNGQTISPGGIVNAANFEPTLATHSIASIFGEDLSSQTCVATSLPLTTELCGVSVTFEGSGSFSPDAPLFFVSPTQINLQVPSSIFGFVNVCVGAGCERAIVAIEWPAIFEYVTAAGSTEPILIHADGSLVSAENPASNGDILILFATGLRNSFKGEIRMPDAEPAPNAPLLEYTGLPLVVVDDVMVRTDFAGLAPGFVSLAQFNFRLAAAFGQEVNFLPGRHELWIRTDTNNSKRVILHVNRILDGLLVGSQAVMLKSLSGPAVASVEQRIGRRHPRLVQ